MYLVLVYVPLVSSLLLLVLNKYIARNGIIFLLFFCIMAQWFLSFLTIFELILSNSICIIQFCKWVDVGNFNAYWEFLYDALTSIMLFIIITISFCVHLYSIEYMFNDPHLCRFLSYLSLFTFFMIILVTAGNLLQLFLGWEGVGFCSYLLINFWYTRIVANKAAMKALIINKVGDVTLLLGIILFFLLYNTLNFTVINCVNWLLKKNMYCDLNVFWVNIDYSLFINFLFIIGVCAKSAQMGLHTWLPDAMEGPTPVSALIHAATMVTAGVFLLLRLAHILKYNENCLLLISFIGGITAICAASIGLFQNDIKKVIAYSTCSQLGYMILSCGLNNYVGSLFHLMNHAFFKALLFLSAGAIIHSMLDQQDMRRMGMLLKYLPLSYIMVLVGSLAIMGIPFLTGFYSKEFMLEYTYNSKVLLNYFLYWLSILTVFLTSFYSIKLLFLTFYNMHNSYFFVIYKWKDNKFLIQESGRFVTVVLIILYFGSVFIGFIFQDIFVGEGTDIWINTLDTESYKDGQKVVEVEFLSWWVKRIPIILTLFSVGISLFFYKNYIYVFFVYYIFVFRFRERENSEKVFNERINSLKSRDFERNDSLKFIKSERIIKGNNEININKRVIEYFSTYMFKLFIFFYNAHYFNDIYNSIFYKYRNLGYLLFKNLDKGIIENRGPMFIVNSVQFWKTFFSKKHKGSLDHYVFIMIFGLFFIAIFFYFLNRLYYDFKIFFLLLILIYFERFCNRLWEIYFKRKWIIGVENN